MPDEAEAPDDRGEEGTSKRTLDPGTEWLAPPPWCSLNTIVSLNCDAIALYNKRATQRSCFQVCIQL